MLTDLGYSRPSYNDILADKIDDTKKLFGEDIKTDDTSTIGKYIRIGAYGLAKAYEDIELSYYSRFISTASGLSLDRLCGSFVGVTRNPAVAAEHKVTISGTAGKTVSAGFVVRTDDYITFFSTEDVTIGTDGKGILTVICTATGEIGNIGNNEITIIVNPDINVDKIISSEITVYGEEEESDYALRRRAAQALQGIGSGTINAIRAAVLRVPTVISVGIIENDTDATDSNGRPAHSFECYVYGGENYEQEIAEAIFSKKPIGIKSISTSTTPITKTVTDDGGYSHTITFSHTENVNILFKINIKKDNEFETDGQNQIKSNITEYISNLGVGKSVVLSALYGYIHEVSGVVDVPSITVSTNNGSSYTSSNVSISSWQVAKTINDNIDIEVVT